MYVDIVVILLLLFEVSRQGRRLTLSEKLDYNTRMARPRKEGRLRMDTDLRIPVTSEQKALIAEATRDEPEGMAAWARAILLRAAQERVAERRAKRAEQG
jgi:hypothetical protein